MMNDESIKVFDQLADRYDQWFDRHVAVFESEVLALKKIIPAQGRGLEVGTGSGRFAAALGIREGVEPSAKLASLAGNRGVQVHPGVAESLPFPDDQFDYLLFGTVLCYLDDPLKALSEAVRVLKPTGLLLIAMLDKGSFLVKEYENKKPVNPFYRHAHFYTVNEMLILIHALHFREESIYQTIFSPLENITTPQAVRSGYGEGGFVVISARLHLADYREP
ncbi:putative methyltransferase YcgJ [Aquicella siphonis]|uniref:Putative methyltransferase YcgJ n=1 Tax=Aquicella siphonis TaxID=254247 RepID=A0A5E4PH39_9COXI|nr:class I SAM-dependent methyltransferase [Aquicella siphonis]VVC75621.1 putative methyltransferase YcgJ [Aquicella siphonis]